jgi:ankyrin repeat protein
MNKTNEAGDTALNAAIVYGYNDIVKFLIEKGADKYIKNKEGKAALDVAKDNQNQEAIKILTTKK